MLDLRKLFVREARRRKKPAELDSSYHPSDRPGDGLEVEYQALIAQQFRKWGISPSCVTVEVQKLGQGPDGFDVLVGMVRLHGWQRISALRVLLGLPLLEAKVRKSVQASWLADYSHFGGLWLHASESVAHEGGKGELRDLLMQLAPPSPVPGANVARELAADYASSVGPTTSSLAANDGLARVSGTGAESVPG